MSVTTIGSREARKNWRDLLDTAYSGTADTIIERNGKAVAVLIPYEDYLDIQEALEDMRTARRVKELYEAEKAQPTGRSYTEIRAELESKGLLDD
jgi:prevent-host-death family protein